MIGEENIKNNTVNGNCSRCGNCCGSFIPFTDEEAKVIKEYVNKNNIKPENRISDNFVKALCPFFNQEEYKCNIYEVRPFVCRDFICSRKNWKERRDYYSSISKYNGSHNNNTQLVSFDDIIYDDNTFTLNYLIGMATENNIKDPSMLVHLFMCCRRLDLLPYFSVVNDKNETLTGKQLFEIYMKETYKMKTTYDLFIKQHPEYTLVRTKEG